MLVVVRQPILLLNYRTLPSVKERGEKGMKIRKRHSSVKEDMNTYNMASVTMCSSALDSVTIWTFSYYMMVLMSNTPFCI